MPIVKILSLLLGDPHAYFTGYVRIFPLFPRLTRDGWLIWLWPVWREDSSSGYGTDSSWAWEFHRQLPENRKKPTLPGIHLSWLDKWIAWVLLFLMLAILRQSIW